MTLKRAKSEHKVTVKHSRCLKVQTGWVKQKRFNQKLQKYWGQNTLTFKNIHLSGFLHKHELSINLQHAFVWGVGHSLVLLLSRSIADHAWSNSVMEKQICVAQCGLVWICTAKSAGRQSQLIRFGLCTKGLNVTSTVWCWRILNNHMPSSRIWRVNHTVQVSCKSNDDCFEKLASFC